MLVKKFYKENSDHFIFYIPLNNINHKKIVNILLF
jgi:hypothetical protein